MVKKKILTIELKITKSKLQIITTADNLSSIETIGLLTHVRNSIQVELIHQERKNIKTIK